MPAERINVSFEPRPLELLYNKYGPNKMSGAPSSSSTTPFTQPNPSSPVKPKPAGLRKTGHRSELPPRIPRAQELGDLKKLGRELTKMERVQMFLDMSASAWKGKGKSHSQPSSSGVHVHCLNGASCSQCSKDTKTEAGQSSKLRNLKSKLRLVATRTSSDDTKPQQQQLLQQQHDPQDSSTPLRHSSQNVVPLPLLQLGYQRNASSSEDFAALRDARKTLRHMLYPQPSVSRRAAAVWNYRFGNVGSQYPTRPRDFLKEYFGDMVGSDRDSSSHLMASAAAPACSPADDFYETKSTTTFDADRVDIEQFDYVFDAGLSSGSSSTGSWDSALSAQSDTATYSARAQRPSTTDTVATPQRHIETRASMAPPLSPLSPRQKTREGESWPPQYTVVPNSWPSLDDPFRFQYLGCGVHRDIMRRLHKSRGRRRNGKHGRGGSDSDQHGQQEQQPQKLKVVMPTYAECSVCNSYDCEHVTPRNSNTTGLPSGPASLAAKSAKSRSSLSMSVCTVLSRQTKPHERSGRSPSAKRVSSRPRLEGSPDGRRGMLHRLDKTPDAGKMVPISRGPSKFGAGVAFDRRQHKV